MQAKARAGHRLDPGPSESRETRRPEPGPLVDGSGQTKIVPLGANLSDSFRLSDRLFIGAAKTKTHLPSSIFCYGVLRLQCAIPLVFRHERRMELVERSGRTTGRLGYTCRLEPMPSEGRQCWHNDALSSPQPQPPALFLRDDCRPPGAVGDGHRRRFRRGRRTFPGTTGRMEQRAD